MGKSQLSSKIAELIGGEHDISQFTPQEKAEFIFGLSAASKTMMEIGWIEHTNDWDWWTGVVLNDGSYIGDDDYHPYDENEDPEQRSFADTFKINISEDSYKFNEPNSWYNNLEVTVEFFSGSDKPDFVKTAKIKDIAKIIYTER